MQLHAEHQKWYVSPVKTVHGARTSRRDHGTDLTNQKKAGFPAQELIFCKKMKVVVGLLRDREFLLIDTK